MGDNASTSAGPIDAMSYCASSYGASAAQRQAVPLLRCGHQLDENTAQSSASPRVSEASKRKYSSPRPGWSVAIVLAPRSSALPPGVGRVRSVGRRLRRITGEEQDHQAAPPNTA